MAGGPRLPRRGRVRVLLLLSLVAAAVVGGARPSAGQSLNQIDLDHRSALQAWEYAKSAWDAQHQRFLAALETVAAAKRSGNAGRINAADALAAAEAAESSRLRRVFDDAERLLEARRRDLRMALQREVDARNQELARTASPAQRAQLTSLIRGHQSQMEQLEVQQVSSLLRPALRFLPAYDLDPRLGRDDLLAMIQLLDRRTTEYGQELRRIDDEIARLRRRQESLRLADATSVGRFGAGEPPGAARPRDAGTAGAAAPQTLEQQIEALTALKSELELMRHQLEVRVETIREQLPPARGAP